MEKQQYQRVMQVLGEAIECDPVEREAWLTKACAGDEALYKEVLRLMSHEKTAVNFMEESPFDEVVRRQREERSMIGRQVGSYKIIEEIGRGGMGAVYLAQRADEQYESLVAVKVIKRGMDTDHILRSFRNERQILAYLNHPNIVRLFDGGTTVDGLPYFIMGYINGQPIKEYCDEKRLSVDERLNLFLKVCSAVQYAHQNLIVHRDLKPSNILVTEEGVPKLLDFGIAKILSQDNTDQEQTATMARAMTPEYASPEQVRGERVTTASDIYSLGVILYELLTGRRPYSFKGRTQAEVAQLISASGPGKPSTAVSHIEEVKDTDGVDANSTSEAISTARDASPVELSRRLRGDLDNIVLKAMRKEQERRYSSVEQFAEDIERHLEGLPVRARKDTFSYRASKFVQRNRVGVAAAALIMLTLIGGIIATAWESHLAQAERAKAERRFNDVRSLVNSLLFQLDVEIEKLPGSTKARELLVKQTLNYLDSVSQEASGEVLLQREIATGYEKLGDVQSRLNSPNLGDTRGAMDSYQKSLKIRKLLFADNPNDSQLGLELALAYNRMGDMLSKTSNAQGALDNYRQALELAEKIAAHDPAQARGALGYSYLMVGRALLKTGDLPAALESFQKSLAIREAMAAENPKDESLRRALIPAYDGVAYVLSLYGKPSEALDYYRKSEAISGALFAANPLDADFRRTVMDTEEWIAITFGEMGENTAGLNYHLKALALCQAQLASDPANAQALDDIGDVYQEIGNTLTRLGKPKDALDNFHKSLENYQALSDADPTDANAKRQVYLTIRLMGNALMLAGKTRDALENYRQALSVFQELSQADPSNAEIQYDMGVSYRKISEALAKSGDMTRALESSGQALAIFEMLVQRSPANVKIRTDLALTYYDLGAAQSKLASDDLALTAQSIDEWRQARSWYQKSLDIYQDMKSKGTLSGADAGKPDGVSGNIAKCNEALKKLGLG